METRRNQGICLLIVQTMNCICHENEFCENNYATELIFGLFTRLCWCEYLNKIEFVLQVKNVGHGVLTCPKEKCHLENVRDVEEEDDLKNLYVSKNEAQSNCSENNKLINLL